MTRRDRRDLRRIIWLANQGEPIDDLLDRWGFEHTLKDGHPVAEWSVWQEGYLVAVIHEHDDECFLFMWTPEARCPWVRQAFWRIRHPRTALQPHPAR